MIKNVADTVRDAIDKIPPLSIVIEKIIKLTSDPKTSAQSLADVIQLDPILTSRILQLVNSAYFSVGQELRSLKQSIVVLGFNTIKNVALSTAILSRVKIEKDNSVLVEEFWKHSFGVGITSKMIAELSGVSKQYSEDFFVAGLIHNIGEILICNTFPDECERMLEIVAENKLTIPQIERNILGLSHQEIGIAIGKKWNFEQHYLYAVGRHHNPVMEGSHSKYSMIVGAANYMVNTAKISDFNDGIITPLPEIIWSKIGVDYSKVLESMPQIPPEIEKARISLQ